MNNDEARSEAFNPKEKKFLTILMGAILFGFGWQIRGTGASDPTVVILLFLLFLSIHYSPRQKFNMIVFAFAIYVFLIMRTGWGTFVAQAGIPGLYPGHIPPNYGEGYDLVVQWWQGYFWLFIVGLSWAGFPSLIFGGYFFTTFKYTARDLFVGFILFLLGRYMGSYIAEWIIPMIAPQFYHEIYLPGLSTRNYQSMRGNLSTAIAIIPVLLYVYYVIKDKGFVKRSVLVMCFFGIGLSVADIWQAVGRNNPEWELPFWSLWEYFSGFIFGGLVFWYYSRFSEDDLRKSDISPGLEGIGEMGKLGRFIIYGTALYFLVLYGLQESISGSIKQVCERLEVDPWVSPRTIRTAVVVVAMVPYYLYLQGKIGAAFYKKSFREKCLIALIVLLPIYYLLFSMRHLVTGEMFQPKVSLSAVWLDTASFVIIEIYAVYLYRSFKRAAPPSTKTELDKPSIAM